MAKDKDQSQPSSNTPVVCRYFLHYSKDEVESVKINSTNENVKKPNKTNFFKISMILIFSCFILLSIVAMIIKFRQMKYKIYENEYQIQKLNNHITRQDEVIDELLTKFDKLMKNYMNLKDNNIKKFPDLASNIQPMKAKIIRLPDNTRIYNNGYIPSSCHEYLYPTNTNPYYNSSFYKYVYEGAIGNGVYNIKVAGYDPKKVYCKMEEGGWTVLLARKAMPYSHNINFDLGWVNYKNGFGDPFNEYWLGLDYLHEMTKNGAKLQINTKMRIPVADHSHSIDDIQTAFYDYFSVCLEDANQEPSNW